MADEISTGPDATPRLLAAASRLLRFTIAELAANARVDIEAARSFVRRSPEVVEANRKRSEGRGRPQTVWELRSESRESVASYLAKLSHAVSQRERGVSMSSTPPALRLLRTTLADLEAKRISRTEDRTRAIARAALHLAAAEASLRDRREMGLPIMLGEEQETERAQLRLAALRDSSPSSVRMSQLPDHKHQPPEERLFLVRRFLENWPAPVEIPAIEREVAEATFSSCDPADLLESEVEAVGDVIVNALHPGYTLLSLRHAWTNERRAALAQAIRDRLSNALPGVRPATLAALAVAAAAIDDASTAEALLRALLIPGAWADLGETGRRICDLVLARLARPSADPSALRAAAACHYLVTRSDVDETELPVLVPPALRGPYANPGILLNKLASLLFDANGLKEGWSDRVNQNALMFNLALVLHDNGFWILQQQISGLLDREYGCALLTALSTTTTGALTFHDRNSEAAFTVSPGKLLAEQAGLMATEVPLRVRREERRRRLSSLLTQLAPEREGVFTGRLAQANRPALRLVHGGIA